MVVWGFNNIGQPICVTPVSTWLYVTGQTLGDTLRFDGSSWVRNNLLFNDGTSIWIADQTPSYLLDVGGTANFLGIRFPTWASSGYVLTSDASGVATWSNAPNISLSWVTWGSQYVVPKFGLWWTGLILSSIYDDGVTVGINTLVPNASYKLDLVGGDARLNGVRYWAGWGNLASNVAIGLNAFGANVTSPNNVIIGNLAGSTLTAGAGGNILIWNTVNTTTATSSNELNIGNWIYGNNGNIGLGTGVGITTRLMVDGQIQITGGSPAAWRYLMSDASGIGVWTWIVASSVTATGIVWGTEYYLTKFWAGGNGIYASVLYESGGYLGLNNVNPSAQLDVNGTIRIRSGSTLWYVLTSDSTGIASWQAPGVSMNTWNIIGNASTTAWTHFLGTTDAQDLVFKTNNVEYMRILTTGNVGIGTASPGQKLTLSGGNFQYFNGSQWNGRYLMSDANGVATWTGYVVATSLNLAGAVSGSTLYFRSGAWNVGTGIYNAWGNIGIGTVNPGSALEVAGQVKITWGTPGAGKFLVSDASWLASWQSSTATLSGTYWSLSGNSVGDNDFVGTLNSQDLRFRVNNVQIWRLYVAGGMNFWTGNTLSSSQNTFVIWNSNTITGSNISVLWYGNRIANSTFDGLVVGNNNTMSAWGWPIIVWRNNSSLSTYDDPTMFGSNNQATYHDAILLWMSNSWWGESNQPSLAVWAFNQAGDNFVWYREETIAVGVGNRILNQFSSAFGRRNTVTTSQSSVFGANITNNIAGSTQVWPNNTAKITIFTGWQVAIGTSTITTGATLKVAGQVEITWGSPAAWRMLISDATWLASWTGVITATNLNLAGAVNGSTIYYSGSSWQVGTGIYNAWGNIGIGTANPGARLEVGWQVKITGGTPGLNKVLTSDASGLATWTTALSSLSGSFWSLSGNSAGANDYIGTSNAQNVRFYSNGTQKMVLDTSGNLGIGTSTGTAKLEVAGQVKILGGLPGAGRVLTSDAVGLAYWTGAITATSLNLAGGVTGSTIYYNSGSWNVGTGMFNNGTRVGIGTVNPGAALEVAGQVKITGGIPGAGKVLTSDATGLAYWTWAVVATSLSIPGSITWSTLFYSGGAWQAGTGIYNAWGNIGIGGTAVSDSRLILNSGLTGTSWLRFAQVNSTSSVVSNNVIGLWVDAAGNVVPISNGDVIVYDGITTWIPSPNPDNPNRRVSYDFNQYFRIPAKQSFVVTDGLAPWQNAPYIGTNAASSVCEWTGTVGSGMSSCPSWDFPGSPYNSFTMSARSDADYGYQIGLAYRWDIQLMARSWKFRDGSDAGTDISLSDYGSGIYINGTTTPAPWYKVVTVPTNNIQWFYIDTGYTGQWNTTGNAGNVWVGTNAPVSRFEIWNHNSGPVLMHYRGTNNLGIGSGSVRIGQTGNSNTALWHETLYTLTNGYSNTAAGYKSLRLATTGYNNSAYGQESLYNLAGGSWNSALGYQSAFSTTSGTGNVAVGSLSLYYNMIGANNIGIWYNALRGTTGNSTNHNIGIWLETFSGTTGNNNIGIGGYAGDEHRSGNNNIAIWYNAQVINTAGSDQLSIGNWIYGSGGTIAIGTTNLATAAKLKIAGQIEITWGSPGAGKVLTSDANGLATWQTPASGSGGWGGSSGTGWWLTGNAGTSAATNYVGTSDAVDFRIGTNGTEKVRIESWGDVGIGTNNPGSKLDVAWTVKLWTNGTQFNAILRATINRDLATINTWICRAEDFTVTNAITTGSVFVSPSANHEDRLIISAARVRAAGIVEIEFCNVSAWNINPTAKDYYITVIQ
jgi:hypothetical protein